MRVLVKARRAEEVPPLETTEVTLVTPCAQKTPFRLLTARTVRELICSFITKSVVIITAATGN